MSYSVYCWKNTGYNAVNIPDSPALLGDAAYQLPALDIVQDWGLSSVRVRTTAETDVQNIDYVRIGAEYYSVSGVAMQAPDVAELSLVYDAVTSAGGPTQVSYLDGITERHTVGDDTMFKYTQADELTAPREALQITSGGMKFQKKKGSTLFDRTYIESTIDLVALGKQFDDSGNFKGDGITFTDTDGENSVTVPYTSPVPENTVYLTDTATINGHSAADSITMSIDGCALYHPYGIVSKGIAAARSLGVESAIIAQFQLPKMFCTINDEDMERNEGRVSRVIAVSENESSGLPFNYATVRNNRVLYGEYNKYGLITADGSRGEFLPEQIAEGSNASPTVCVIADPTPQGRPYFRFLDYMGKAGGDADFMNGAVPGLQWKQIPLVFTTASNSVLNTMNFTNSSKTASTTQAYNMTTQNIADQKAATGYAFGTGKELAGAISNIAKGDIGGFAGSMVNAGQSLANMYFDSQTAAYRWQNMGDQYKLAREKELQNYGFSQSVVVPEIMFPYNSEYLRDFVGNGVYVYRYRYTANDIARIDKLLTMYGYKDTVALDSSCFNQRKNFDYVRASGVSIGGSLPKWKKATIAEQLNAGVRVWHVKPSPAYYTNNPIKGA